MGRGRRRHRRTHHLRRPGRDAPAARRRIDLDGRLVTPGIIDSHNHLLLGFDEDAVSLEGAETLERGAPPHRASSPTRRPDLDWICAENAVYSVVEGRRPNAADLDGLTDRPIFVTTYDQHSVWLNACRAARCSASPAAPTIAWGRPRTRPGHGRADRLGDRLLHQRHDRGGPRRTAARHPDVLAGAALPQAARQHAHGTALGITTVVEPQVPLAELTAVRARAGRGRAPTSRVIAALFHPVGADGAFRARLRDAVDSARADDAAAASARSSSTPTT